MTSVSQLSENLVGATARGITRRPTAARCGWSSFWRRACRCVFRRACGRGGGVQPIGRLWPIATVSCVELWQLWWWPRLAM